MVHIWKQYKKYYYNFSKRITIINIDKDMWKTHFWNSNLFLSQKMYAYDTKIRSIYINLGCNILNTLKVSYSLDTLFLSLHISYICLYLGKVMLPQFLVKISTEQVCIISNKLLEGPNTIPSYIIYLPLSDRFIQIVF